MANQWFKFYGGEYLSDPKIGRLSAQQRSCWITLLSMASVENGNIRFLSTEDLLQKSGIKFDPYDTTEWDNLQNILKVLENYKMVEILKDGTIKIINWEKRQETAMSGYERVKAYRERKKITHKQGKKNINDNEMITDDNGNDNVRIEEKRIEKKREEEKETEKEKDASSAKNLKQEFFENKLFEVLKQTFPNRNYDLEFDLMIDWWQKNKGKMPKNISAFKNWLAYSKPQGNQKIIREKTNL